MYNGMYNGLKMSVYEVYWLIDFTLTNNQVRQEIIMLTLKRYALVRKKHSNKYKEILVILQSIGIIVIKSKETRVVIYTCRYSSGHLIPIIQSCQDELGIKVAPNSFHRCYVTYTLVVSFDYNHHCG